MSQGDESSLILDLSWTKRFHTVNIARWSEPPGREGSECATWRVLVGAFGHHVSSNQPGLKEAIAEALEKVASDPLLRTLLPPRPAPPQSEVPSLQR